MIIQCYLLPKKTRLLKYMVICNGRDQIFKSDLVRSRVWLLHIKKPDIMLKDSGKSGF
jgi:hypothetical protein